MTVEERRIGTYKAPVLLIEKDTVEAVRNPIARLVPGAEGAVDLYVAPAYDDIASLYLEGDQWVVHYSERPDPGVTHSVVVVTTILAPEQASAEDLASLYRARWNNELDLRSIKVTLQMDMLRCETPKLVGKEIWTYNLIRTAMAQAAASEGVAPRSISFKATPQVFEAFRPLIAYHAHCGAATGRSSTSGRRRAPRGRPFRPVRAPHGQAKTQEDDRLTTLRREIKLRMLKRFFII